MNYRDNAGYWVPISNELVDAPGETYAVQNEANSYSVLIPENPATTPMKFATDNAWVEMKLATSESAEPDVEGDAAVIETSGGTSVTYQAQNSGVKESITLTAPPASPVSYRYLLSASAGITPVLNQNQVEFQNAQGATQFVMPVPNMSDSATPEPAYTNNVAYQLTAQGNGWVLTATPDFSWLTDPNRVYPVVIDPSVDMADQKDCWIQQDMPDVNRCQNDYLYSGKANGSLRRGLLDFSMNGQPAGSIINSATLYLYLDSNKNIGGQGATTFSLYQPAKAWSQGVTWNQSGIENWNGGSTSVALSNSINLGSPGVSGWVFWDTTGAIRGWVNGSVDNRGFLVREDNEGHSMQVGFLSNTNALTQWRPILRIDYTPNQSPNVAAQPVLAPAPGSGGAVTTATPVISTTATDPDNDSVFALFQVIDSSNNLVYSASSGLAASGQTLSVQIPAGVLSNNRSYTVRALAKDGRGEQAVAFSGSTRFTVAKTYQVGDIMDGSIDPLPDNSADDDPDTSPEAQAPPAADDQPYTVVSLYPDWKNHLDTSAIVSDNSLIPLAVQGSNALAASSAAPAGSIANYATWGACGPSDDDLKIIRDFFREPIMSFWIGGNAYLNCGDYHSENFGYWHIYKRHQSDWASKGLKIGDPQWRYAADFGMAGALAFPQFVVESHTGNHCMARWTYVQEVQGNQVVTVDKLKSQVYVGHTGRRIYTAYPSKSWCSTADAVPEFDNR